jgi:hypothetical protein
MTLGLTQPVTLGDPVPAWEFAVLTPEFSHWPVQLLYDLLTIWLCEKGRIERGQFFPMRFFRDIHGRLCAGNTIGPMRGLYLWNDSDNRCFKTESGAFGLMVAISVTEDEDRLAQETTPAHLVLLLRRMKIGQVSSPFRLSVLECTGASSEWERIRQLSHDDVLRELELTTMSLGSNEHPD